MRIKVFLICVLGCCLGSTAQTHTFTYDAAGNRIRREIVEQKSMVQYQQDTTAIVLQGTEENEIQVQVLPNPTSGLLLVDIQNLAAGAVGSFQVFSLQGAELLRIRGLQTSNTIDLSSLPAGQYVLRLRLDTGWQQEWRVVKIVNNE